MHFSILFSFHDRCANEQKSSFANTRWWKTRQERSGGEGGGGGRRCENCSVLLQLPLCILVFVLLRRCLFALRLFPFFWGGGVIFDMSP